MIEKNQHSKNRDSIVHIKVSLEEKKQIEKKAAEFGGNISQYTRSQLLSPGSNSLARKLQQQVTTLLCHHAEIVARVEDRENYEELKNWEKELWQLLK